MSLLLDALKKAANEKKSADSSNTDGAESEGLKLESVEAPEAAQQEMSNSSAEGAGTKSEPSGDDNLQLDDSDRLSQYAASVATTSTVSDEALQILVHKANKQFKSSQSLIWGSVFFVALGVLVTGGIYFFLGMTDDLAAIESKHKQVMKSVTDTRLSRSVTEKIERQMALDNVQKIAEDSTGKDTVPGQITTQAASRADNQKTQKNLVIKKQKKLDPIDVLTTKAWYAYKEGDYETARSVYTKVLAREQTNRDALLGIAAIAVKQGDIGSAKSIYSELVQLNPRDPIAVAALSNLGSSDLERTSLNELNESKLKLMIRKNSEPSHLYFALGNIYSQQLRWPEAQKSYFNAWQSDNANADYAFNLAVSLDQMGKQKEAINFYKMSLSNMGKGNTQFSVGSIESRLQQLTGGQE